MPTPLIIECVTGVDLPVPYYYGRLDCFGNIDLTKRRSCSASERELLEMCDFWNGACRSSLCLVEGEHCYFQCGNAVDVVE